VIILREVHPADRSKPAGHSITGDCIANRLGHDEAKPGRVDAVSRRNVEKCVRGSNANTPPHDPLEVVSVRDPIRSGEHGTLLRGEFGATLAATGSKDGATGAGAHTEAETVHFGATTVVWLEGSLAHSCISKTQPRMPERIRWPDGQKSTG
jgi:hypothetical protein